MINDFVFICFLLGNDFIPSLLCTQIKIILNNNLKYNMIELLIVIYYSNLLNYNDYIIYEYPTCKINYKSLLNFLKLLSQYENKILNDMYYHEYILYNDTNKITDLNKIDNLIFNFSDDKTIDYFQINNYVHKKDTYKNIKPDVNFNYNYNKYYFDDKIENVIDNYIEGLIWTFFYYNKECVDWIWYYKYENSPLLYDLINYLTIDKIESIFNRISINKYNKGIIQPYDHLSMILPKQLHYLLPKKY
jgi:5'-3' exoribonuclease 2